MAVTALIPPEKNESLIYVVPGFATAFWIVSWFWQEPTTDGISDLTARLAIIGIVASVVSIFLYILKIEDWFIKTVIRKRTNRIAKNAIEELFLAGNLFVKSWEINLEDIQPLVDKNSRKFPYLKDYVITYIQNAVSSYPIRQRSWPLRLLVYSWISLFLLGVSGTIQKGLSSFHLDFVVFGASWDALLFPAVFCGALLLMILQAVLRNTGRPGMRNDEKRERFWRRSSRLCRDAAYTAELLYLYSLVGVDSTRHASEYIAGTPLFNLRNELQYLQDALLRNDWSVFSNRWMKNRTSLIREIQMSFNRVVQYSGPLLWADFIRLSSSNSSEEYRKLCWFTYFSSQMLQSLETKTSTTLTSPPPQKYRVEVDDYSERIILTLKSYYSNSPRFANARSVIELLKVRPERLLEDAGMHSRFILRIANALGETDDIPDGTAMKYIVQCIADASHSPDVMRSLSLFVLDYLKEATNEKKNPQLWEQVPSENFDALYSQLAEHEDRVVALRAFLEKGSPDEIKKVLAHGKWDRDIRDDSESGLILDSRSIPKAND